MARLKSALRRHAPAMAALRALGIQGRTIERLGLGIKQPYIPRGGAPEIRDALAFPLMSCGRPLGRYGYYNVPSVTANPPHPKGWGAGVCAEYRLGPGESAVALVCPDVLDAWLAWQSYGDGPGAPAVLSRTHWAGWPGEWKSSSHWSRYETVVTIDGDGQADFLTEIAPMMGREVRVHRSPPPFDSFSGMVRAGRSLALEDVLARSEPTIAFPAAADCSNAALGVFEAAPIDVSSGYAGGRLYYPVSVELRSVEGTSGRVMHRYRTMVVRSDGALLSAEGLPAPCGTGRSERVLSLSDGTRIRGLPSPSPSASWSFPSIEAFVAWRRLGGPPPFRSLANVLADVETHLRLRVWLPDDGSYVVVACFVAMTFCYQLFPALPVLLVVGPAASGKSELGEAVAMIGQNAVLAGQLRAAGLVRLLDETSGLLVLDDMDGTGPASIDGDGEVAMALKTGYKRSTSRKPLADRAGRIRMVDYFGPKLVTRTRPATPVLGSRMIVVHAAPRPPGAATSGRGSSDGEMAALRDELHCWAMASAADVVGHFDASSVGDGGRWSEITRPLLAIARCAGDSLAMRLAAALASDPRSAGRQSCP